MSKLSIRTGIKLDSVSKIQQEVQAQLDKVSKNLNIKINKVDISNLSSAIEQINKKLNSLNSDKMKFTPKVDTQEAKKSLDDYISLVRNKVQSVLGETDKISKISIKTDNNGNFIGASAIAQINEADQRVIRLNQDLNILGQTYSQNDAKSANMFAKQNSYLDSAINKLQQYKQQLQESNNLSTGTRRENISNEIDVQINKLNQLKNANQILGSAEKARINETVNALKQQTSALTKQSTSLTGILKQMLTYAGGGTLIYSGIREVKQGINDIISLDSSMRDLRKVAKATNEELESFTDTANNMAIAVGASTEGIIEATTEYSKLGLAIETASESAKNATIFSNVGDMGVKDASKSLIRIQKGFDYDLSNMEDMLHIMDAVNEVGNNFSSSTKDIADGLSRFASVSYEAGNTLEESIGLFISANASIQDADVTGTALKTIEMRLKGVKTEIDETSIPVSKLRDGIKQLTASIGEEYDIMKDDSTFKSSYEIMTNLSEIYPKLSNAQRSWLSYMVAGTRQANVFNSAMFNMEEGIQATGTALDSEGSAMRENYIYMQSIEGRINEFSETLKKLWIDSINTDTIKDIVSLGTSVIEVLDVMVNKFGIIPTAIGVATLAIRLFNKEMYDGITKNIPIIGTLNTKINGITESVQQSLGAKISGAFIKFRANIASTTVASASLSAQNVVLATTYGAVALASTIAQTAITMGISFLVTTAITAVVKFCDSLITTKEELKELNNELVNNVSTTKKNITTAEDAIKTIEELNQKLSETKDIKERKKLTNDLTQAQKQLADAIPETADSTDENGVLMSTQIEQAKQLVEIKKQEQETEAHRFFEENKNLQADIENIKEKKKQLEAMRVAQAKGEDQYTYNRTWKQGNKVNTQVVTESFKSDDVEKLNSEISDTITVMGQASQMASILGNNLTASERKAIEEIKNYNIELELNSTKVKENADSQEVLASSTDKVKETIESTNDALKEISGTFDTLTGSMDIIDKVIEEYTKYGGVTQSTYSKLMSTYPDVFREMQKEGDMIENLTNLKKNYQKEQQKQLNQAWKTVSEETNLINEQMQNEVKAYNETANAKVKIDQNKKVSTTDLVNFISSSTARLNNALSGMYGEDAKNWANVLQNKSGNYTNFVKTVVSATSIVKKVLSAGIGLLNENGIGVNYSMPKLITTTPPSIVSDSTAKDAKKTVQTYTPTLEMFYKLNNAIEDVNNALAINRVRQEKAFGKDKQRLVREEIALLEKQKNLYSQLMSEQSGKISSLKRQLSSLGATFDKEGNILNYEKLLGKTASGDKAVENLKKLEDLVKNYTDLTQQELPKCQEEWEKLNNEIGDVYKEMAETVSDAEQEIYKIIEDYATKRTNKKIEEINKQIDAEKKRYDAEKQEEDLSKKNKQLAELKAEMDKFALATDELGKAKFEQLKKEYEEARNELNDTIKENAHNDNISNMENEIQDLEKELEDFLNSDELDKIITNAMKTGVVQIGNEVIKLDDAMTSFYKDTIVGQETLNLKMKEMLEIMATAKELAMSLPDINNGANIQEIKSIPTVPVNYANERSIVNNTQTISDPKIEVVINIEGDATDETVNKMEKIAEKAVKKGLKEYDKSFK